VDLSILIIVFMLSELEVEVVVEEYSFNSYYCIRVELYDRLGNMLQVPFQFLLLYSMPIERGNSHE